MSCNREIPYYIVTDNSKCELVYVKCGSISPVRHDYERVFCDVCERQQEEEDSCSPSESS